VHNVGLGNPSRAKEEMKFGDSRLGWSPSTMTRDPNSKVSHGKQPLPKLQGVRFFGDSRRQIN
jgi:hypothetical protein